MIIDWIYILTLVLYVAGIVALGALLWLLVEITRVVTNARRLMQRIDTITDFASWISIFKKLSPRRLAGRRFNLNKPN